MRRDLIAQYFVFAILLTGSACMGFFGSAEQDPLFVFANLIGVVASGIGTSTAIPTITTVHQFIYFEIATTPQSIKVNVNGDTLIMDLDTAGINVIKNIRSNGTFTNGFLFQMATGMISGVNVDITVVNNVAAAFNVFGFNRRRMAQGYNQYVQTLGINLNASQSFDVTNFIYFGAPSMASADILNIYRNQSTSGGPGRNPTIPFSAKQELETFRGTLQLFENQSTALKSAAFDNYDRDIDRINFIPVAAQKIYIQRIVPAGAQITASLLS